MPELLSSGMRKGLKAVRRKKNRGQDRTGQDRTGQNRTVTYSVDRYRSSQVCNTNAINHNKNKCKQGADFIDVSGNGPNYWKYIILYHTKHYIIKPHHTIRQYTINKLYNWVC